MAFDAGRRKNINRKLAGDSVADNKLVTYTEENLILLENSSRECDTNDDIAYLHRTVTLSTDNPCLNSGGNSSTPLPKVDHGSKQKLETEDDIVENSLPETSDKEDKMEAVSLIECDTVVSKTCPAVDDTNDQRVCVYSVTATHHGDRSDSDNPSRFSGDSKQRVLPKVTLDVCKPKLKMQNDNNDGILVRASDVKDKMEDDDVHPQGDQAASILYDERILVDSASDVWSCDRIENSESLSEISDVWDEIEILMEDDSVLLENLGPTEYNRSIKRVLVDNKGDNAGDDDQNGSSLASGDDKSTVIPTVASNASTPIPQNKVIEEVLSGIVDAEEVKSTTEAVEQPKALQSKKPAVKELKKLPIDDHKAKILERIQRHRVICVQGETGSGKSTRVPQYIVEDYRKRR